MRGEVSVRFSDDCDRLDYLVVSGLSISGDTQLPQPHTLQFTLQVVKTVSEIHNLFKGEEGALRYLRWLSDP